MIVSNTLLLADFFLLLSSVTILYAEYDHELVKIHSQAMYIVTM